MHSLKANSVYRWYATTFHYGEQTHGHKHIAVRVCIGLSNTSTLSAFMLHVECIRSVNKWTSVHPFFWFHTGHEHQSHGWKSCVCLLCYSNPTFTRLAVKCKTATTTTITSHSSSAVSLQIQIGFIWQYLHTWHMVKHCTHLRPCVC